MTYISSKSSYLFVRCQLSFNMADEVKEHMSKNRLGFSRNYVNRPAAENFPLYTTHQCMVRKHLTPEVSDICFCFYQGPFLWRGNTLSNHGNTEGIRSQKLPHLYHSSMYGQKAPDSRSKWLTYYFFLLLLDVVVFVHTWSVRVLPL